MNKKGIFVLIVIISGFLLGFLLSGIPNIFKSINLQPSDTKNSSVQTKEINSTGLVANLSAAPTTIKESGVLDPATELEKIEKSNLYIKVDNNSSFDLTGVEIWIITSSKSPTGVATLSDETKFDPNKASDNTVVFHIADIGKGSSKTINILYFIHKKGEAKIHVELKTKQGASTKTNTVTLQAIE